MWIQKQRGIYYKVILSVLILTMILSYRWERKQILLDNFGKIPYTGKEYYRNIKNQISNIKNKKYLHFKF